MQICEPLPLISSCVLFWKAVTTGFAIINCRFKTLERRLVEFIGYCLPRLASRSSFWTKSELSFKSSVKACLSALDKGWWTSLCWLWAVRRVQRKTQIPQVISRTLWLNGAQSLSWPSDWLSWLVPRLPYTPGKNARYTEKLCHDSIVLSSFLYSSGQVDIWSAGAAKCTAHSSHL
jgi:hypothetical protein